LIGSIRRERLNHFIVLNARHLKRTLAAYFRYCHRSRPHLALSKQCPIERQVMKDSDDGGRRVLRSLRLHAHSNEEAKRRTVQRLKSSDKIVAIPVKSFNDVTETATGWVK